MTSASTSSPRCAGRQCRNFAPPLAARAAFYHEPCAELYTAWMVRIRDLLGRLDAITFPDLPEVVPAEEVLAGRGVGRAYDLSRRYHDVLDLGVELWQNHFELLNLGYAAYLDYFEFCRQLLPQFSDLQIARTVAGIDDVENQRRRHLGQHFRFKHRRVVGRRHARRHSRRLVLSLHTQAARQCQQTRGDSADAQCGLFHR